MYDLDDDGQKIEWDFLSKEYENIVEEISSLELLERDVYNQLVFNHLTYGLVPAEGWDRVQYGTAIYVHADRDAFGAGLWVELAFEFGITIPESMMPPPYVANALRQKSDLVATLSRCFAAREANNEFIIAWGRLQRLYERYHFLLQGDNANCVSIRQALYGMESGIEVQKHWYAHWINAHAPSSSVRDRNDAGSKLASLCFNIYLQEIKPSDPYPVDWYVRMLACERNDKGKIAKYNGKPKIIDSLTDNLVKLGSPAIRKMLAHPAYTPAVLPPLSADKFLKS